MLKNFMITMFFISNISAAERPSVKGSIKQQSQETSQQLIDIQLAEQLRRIPQLTQDSEYQRMLKLKAEWQKLPQDIKPDDSRLQELIKQMPSEVQEELNQVMQLSSTELQAWYVKDQQKQLEELARLKLTLDLTDTLNAAAQQIRDMLQKEKKDK